MHWDTLIGSIFTFVVAPIVGYFIGKFNERDRTNRDEDRAIRAGVRALLAYRIYHTWRGARKDGHITIDERAMCRDVYTQYLALGGNGVGAERMAEIEALPHEGERK